MNRRAPNAVHAPDDARVRRRRGGPTLPSPPIVLDREAATPLYRQIEAQLRQAILDRRLRPGTRLPGIRAFARELGVAAITVITAYDQLTAEGFLTPQPGRGTLVALDLPMTPRVALPARLRAATERPEPALPDPTAQGPDRPFFDGRWPAVRYDFRTGSTRLDLFPARTWERTLQAAWRDLSADHAATGYLEPAGDPRLRREVAAYLARSRAVRAEPEQVVITAGAQGALAVAARIWLGHGRRLAVEDPGSPHLQRTFTALGVGLDHVPVDDRGLPVDQLPGNAAGVLVTPSWQYPRGGTMPVARRLQLLEWASAHRAVIIEDDCDSELRYEGHPLPSLQGLDPDGRVLYVGTFSKVLYPGLRTGYAVVPSPALPLFTAQLEAAARGPGAVDQRALALFIADGHFERHLGRLRAAFAERQDALLSALSDDLGRVMSTTRAPGGTHLVVRIEDGRLSASDLATRARALDVAIEPLALSAALPIGDREFLMHYARMTPDEIREGVRRLARAASNGSARRAIA